MKADGYRPGAQLPRLTTGGYQMVPVARIFFFFKQMHPQVLVIPKPHALRNCVPQKRTLRVLSSGAAKVLMQMGPKLPILPNTGGP